MDNGVRKQSLYEENSHFGLHSGFSCKASRPREVLCGFFIVVIIKRDFKVLINLY